MTSEVNEDNIVVSTTKLQSSSSTNNDLILNCLPPVVTPSTKKSSNESKYGEKLSETTLLSAKVVENKIPEKVRHTSAEENGNTKGYKKDLFNDQEVLNDKYPSRWASSVVDVSDPDEKVSLDDKTYKNCCVESISPGDHYECSTATNASIRNTNMICDRDSSELPCTTTAVNNLNLIGDDRARLGKEAIEKLASQLNKAATTIQDFTQNVSKLIHYSLFLLNPYFQCIVEISICTITLHQPHYFRSATKKC